MSGLTDLDVGADSPSDPFLAPSSAPADPPTQGPLTNSPETGPSPSAPSPQGPQEGPPEGPPEGGSNEAPNPATGSDPVAAYLDGLSANSRPSMKAALSTIAKFFGKGLPEMRWQDLGYEQAQQLRSYLAGKYKGRTSNRMIAAYRGVLKASWRLGQMTTEQYTRAADVKVIRVSEPPAGRRLGLNELKKLVSAGNDQRDMAIICMLYAVGMRRFELVGLLAGDYDRAIGQVTIRGKGNKTRQVVVAKGWRKPIEDWLDAYKPQPSDPLFPSRFQGTDREPLSLTGLSYVVEQRRKLANLQPFTTHDMRRTFITNLIDSGADLVVVKRIAGHSNINTTASYDRRGAAEEAAAIGKLEGLGAVKAVSNVGRKRGRPKKDF